MSRYAVIGLGKFGSWVARTLESLGHQVIAIEADGILIDRHAEFFFGFPCGDDLSQRRRIRN